MKCSLVPVHEICEVPARHCAPIPVTHVAHVVLAKQLHTHHSKDEDDDAQHEGQVGQGPHCVHHDGEDIVERFPRLGKFEHSEQSEGSQHGETGHSFS